MKTCARLLALLLVSALALAGCGGSDKSDGAKDVSDRSPAKIVAAAKKQLASEEFISVKGSGSNAEEGTDLQVDLGFAGDTASGSIAMQGLALELLKAEGASYFKASDEFYRSTAGAAADEIIAQIGGRWVVADPDDENFAQIASFVSKKSFFDELLDPDSKLTKVEGKKVNGVDCIGLKSTNSTFYFDKRNGLPVSLVKDDKGVGSLNFTYDKIDEAEAPSADEIVDLSQL